MKVIAVDALNYCLVKGGVGNTFRAGDGGKGDACPTVLIIEEDADEEGDGHRLVQPQPHGWGIDDDEREELG